MVPELADKWISQVELEERNLRRQEQQNNTIAQNVGARDVGNARTQRTMTQDTAGETMATTPQATPTTTMPQIVEPPTNLDEQLRSTRTRANEIRL
jgi:hypothetical protein